MRSLPFFRQVFRPALLAACLFALTNIGTAQLPAFPGAEGYGKYTSGGRGTPAAPTTVFEVTNLNDDNNPGSLRYALTAPATHRTVVFRVGGTIRLTSQLNIRANTTIAGQTAPGGGICIADKPLVISGDNVILRYVRVRLGDRYQNKGKVDGSGGDDALGNLGNKNIIIDHCSVSWSNDEALTIYRGDSVTLQWNVISEPLNYSYHFEAGGSDYQEHGYGGIWGSRNGSFHHNLILHVKGRAPRFAGNDTYPAGVVEKADFRNNVIYNWIDYSTNGGEGGNYNVVNNYYKYGPSTSTGNSSGIPKRGMIMNPSKNSSLPYPKIYLAGNYVDSYPDITASNWLGMAFADGGSLADSSKSKVDTPFPAEAITLQSAQDAYAKVLQSAGASLPLRDTLDQRLVKDVMNRTGRVIDVQGGFPHGTPFDQTINAWPALASGTPPADQDKDGMADVWEKLNGLNPNDQADRAGIAPNGYTNLENYLNALTDPGKNGLTNVTVAKDGSGDFTTVQAAINAAPTGLTAPWVIFIKNGKYREKITVPSNKPFIQLIGESVANTILYYDDAALTPAPTGGTLGTQGSASFTVNATDFTAINITFANTFGNGSQAVAIVVNNDRAVFKNCRFMGNQDTLYPKGAGTPKHYFRDCYIDGNVDFIFGSSVALFDSCVVYAKSRTVSGNSYITAPNTPAGQAYGYVFRDCILPQNTGATAYFLSRPWQNTSSSNPIANNKNVFLNTIMTNSILPEGWSTWDATTNTSLIYYGEYKSKRFDGSPVDISKRAPWSFQLTDGEAAAYTPAKLFGDWDPCSLNPLICATQAREIAISNFRGTKGATLTTFEWNISWAMNQITYDLYRSAKKDSGYTKIGTVTATNDTSYNFQMTDAIPAAGTSFFYYLIGSKTGLAPHTTDTIEISSIPTINTSGALQAFIQTLGTPSPAQSFALNGENLLGDIVITTPANFEVSADSGKTWKVNPETINLTPINNTLAARNIFVRLNAQALGTYADSLKLETQGGDTKYVKLSGNTIEKSTIKTELLQHWPFTQNANDSTAVRSPGVAASTPTLVNLYSSNGATVAAIPAYSEKFGQAFGASTARDGFWTTAQGGPGGTLRRTHYEQFTVTANEGYSVRIDSIYVTGAFYNTSSNTRLAVVYSRSNFVSDSADVFTTPGGFANPIAMANQTGGPTNVYGLSVGGLNSITLKAGETLTFRFYFSCGSTSAGRYAMLKDVKVLGEAKKSTVTSAKELLPKALLRLYPNPATDQLTVEHPLSDLAATISLSSASGAQMGVWPCQAGSSTVIPLGALPAGMYYATYRNLTGFTSLPFVKK